MKTETHRFTEDEMYALVSAIEYAMSDIQEEIEVSYLPDDHPKSKVLETLVKLYERLR